MLLASLAGLVGVVSAPSPALSLPLAPLGPVKRVGGDKRTGITAEEVKVGGTVQAQVWQELGGEVENSILK